MSPVNDIGRRTRTGADQGNHHGGDGRGRHADDRSDAEYPGRGRTEDRSLAEELDEIIVRLKQRRPHAGRQIRPSSWQSSPAAAAASRARARHE